MSNFPRTFRASRARRRCRPRTSAIACARGMTDSIASEHRPWYRPGLSQQIVIGLVVGMIVGYVSRACLADRPASLDSFLSWVGLIRDVFLHLIRMMIAPLVFASIVQGIAGTEDMKKVGRIGLKALIYFEVLTGLALVVGLLMVNLLKPGVGVVLSGDTSGLGRHLAAPAPRCHRDHSPYLSRPAWSSPWLRATCCKSSPSRSSSRSPFPPPAKPASRSSFGARASAR